MDIEKYITTEIGQMAWKVKEWAEKQDEKSKFTIDEVAIANDLSVENARLSLLVIESIDHEFLYEELELKINCWTAAYLNARFPDMPIKAMQKALNIDDEKMEDILQFLSKVSLKEKIAFKAAKSNEN